MKIEKELEIISFNSFTDELKYKWQELENINSHYIFQRHSWNAYWHEIFKAVYNFHVVLVNFNAKPVAVFPFCINKKGTLKFLQFIGIGQSDYLSPIIDKNFKFSKEIWKIVLDEIKESYDVIRFKNMPGLLKGQENQFVQTINTKISGVSFGLNLPNTYNEYDSSLKRNFRNDNKRNLRRLSEFGNLKFLKVGTSLNNIAEFSKYINISIEQKARRLRNYMGSELLEDSLNQEFYQKSFMITDYVYKLDYRVLTVKDNVILATHWGFFDDDRYYFLFPTIEGKEWYKYSCGKVLIDHLIEFSISKRLKYFDFTIGDENYKKDWCNEQMILFSYTKAQSFSGFLYLCYHQINTIITESKYVKAVWRKLKARVVQKRKRK